MPTSKFIIAIDPGNNTGITYGFSHRKPISELHDFTPKSGTKGGKKTPARKAEEKHIRYGKLWFALSNICVRVMKERELNPADLIIICEGAAGFTKGKAAVEVSNKYRGVVEAFAAIRQCQYIGIQPNDLQRWATGKGRAEKTEMMKVASDKYEYKGNDDNEADSVLLWHFAKATTNYEIAPANGPVTVKYVGVDESENIFPDPPIKTGHYDKNGVEIFGGEKVVLDYGSVHIEGIAKFIDSSWQLYKDDNNHVGLEHNKDRIVVVKERVPLTEMIKPVGEQTQRNWLKWQQEHSQILNKED